MKKFGGLLLLCCLISLPAAARQEIQVYINGKPLALETGPFMESGWVIGPARPVLEALGAEVYWIPYGANPILLVVKDEIKLSAKIGRYGSKICMQRFR